MDAAVTVRQIRVATAPPMSVADPLRTVSRNRRSPTARPASLPNESYSTQLAVRSSTLPGGTVSAPATTFSVSPA